MHYANSSATPFTTANVAVGYQALRGSTTAANNTGIGNVAVGFTALAANTSGIENVAVGGGALGANTVGTGNTAMGDQALAANVAKSGSTAVGWEAMVYADNTATAGTSYNTALGYQALRGSATASANTGASNTALGYQSLLAVTSGSNNVAIGDRAADQLTTGSSNIVIGQNNDPPSNTGSNQIDIGDTIYGDLSADTITIGTTAGWMRALPAAAQTIAAGNTITADACGTMKQITSAGAVTTSTTDTFSTPAAGNSGCCMWVVNTGTNNITLDANANFKTNGGTDQVLTADDAVLVCGNGTKWYQAAPVNANQ
jgi:hypothetical protein